MSKRHFHAMFTVALIKVAKRERQSTSVSINGVMNKENVAHIQTTHIVEYYFTIKDQIPVI